MSDNFTKTKRTEIMSKISGKETKPEILVRQFLFSKGFRFRKNVKELPSKPDILLAKYKTILFIHGCFWHRHQECIRSKLPTSNIEFWKEKIGKNVERDKKNIQELKNLGWRVIVIWQCEIKNIQLRTIRLQKLLEEIMN